LIWCDCAKISVIPYLTAFGCVPKPELDLLRFDNRIVRSISQPSLKIQNSGRSYRSGWEGKRFGGFLKKLLVSPDAKSHRQDHTGRPGKIGKKGKPAGKPGKKAA
jgi:hypothetical protein